MEKYLESDCLTFDKWEDAAAVIPFLLKNGYAVMVTTEEDLYVLNWVWCDDGYANRNSVVFRDRGSVECELFNKANNDNEEEDISEFYARMSGEKQ